MVPNLSVNKTSVTLSPIPALPADSGVVSPVSMSLPHYPTPTACGPSLEARDRLGAARLASRGHSRQDRRMKAAPGQENSCRPASRGRNGRPWPLRAGLAAVLFPLTGTAAQESWHRLASLPQPLGVAAAYAGVSGGALIAGGGANFPDKMPWQGGNKVWQDRIWVLPSPDGTWQEAGRLPSPLAYGVSLTIRNTVLCLGGSDATRHYDGVFALEWTGSRLVRSPTVPPALPIPLAYAAGAVDEAETVYLACGCTRPREQEASNRIFAVNYRMEPLAWSELPPLPAAPRLLPVAAAQGTAFYLFGGAALEARDGRMVRRYLRETWRYTATGGWKRLADLPKPCVAAPSPAPVVRFPDKDGNPDRTVALLLAGDDGSLAGFQPPEHHPGFPGSILRYDFAADRWEMSGQVPAPRATAPCVAWGTSFIIPSGETRPGVRSPEVWSLSVPERERKSNP